MEKNHWKDAHIDKFKQEYPDEVCFICDTLLDSKDAKCQHVFENHPEEFKKQYPEYICKHCNQIQMQLQNHMHDFHPKELEQEKKAHYTISIGKYKDQKYSDFVPKDPKYSNWLLSQSWVFPQTARLIKLYLPQQILIEPESL